MNAMNQPNSLFLGDLSFYCHEDDIRAAFQVFGELTEVRIMRKYDGRSLGYGFVTFKERYNAMRAMDALAGKLLIGRKLNISWAVKKSEEDYQESKKSQSRSKDVCLYSEVHFSFMTKQRKEIITEATIRPLFEEFGFIEDIVIKKVANDSRGQNGHGFVYYGLDPAGISAAIKAAFVICQLEIDGVTYDCALTHLFQQFLRNGGLASVKDSSYLHQFQNVSSVIEVNSSSNDSNSHSRQGSYRQLPLQQSGSESFHEK